MTASSFLHISGVDVEMNLKLVGSIYGSAVVRGSVALAGWGTEWEASIVGEILVKPMSEARGLAFAGLRVFLVGANVAVTNISAELLGCIAERRLYVAREKSKSCVGKIWRGPDWIVQGRSKIIEPFMATGVGATRYGDLNSDLPVCISQDFLHIQTVTSLV